jgi:hypothetical protein
MVLTLNSCSDATQSFFIPMGFYSFTHKAGLKPKLRDSPAQRVLCKKLFANVRPFLINALFK